MASESGRLELTAEQMRSLGYRVVDHLVAHVTGLADQPVGRVGDRAALEARLWEPAPREGMAAEAALELLAHEVWPSLLHVDHPRFYAFVPGPGSFVGAVAEALTAGMNPFAGTWLEASGPAVVELVTIDWLRQLCGLPDSAGGHFTSGGSMATLTALAVARHLRLEDRVQDAVVYASDQTHASVDRALWLLGFGAGQVRRLPVDDRFRLSLPALRSAVAADRSAGRRPFCAVANAGTTNTGAVDPLAEVADLCRDEGMWLHVDGAYGASAVLTPAGRGLLAGMERADSLVLDPHKWLCQPYEIGCVLVRRSEWLVRTFHILPEYLADAQAAGREVNFCDQGLQLTRSFRALKLWLSIKVFGLDAFAQAVARGLELAGRAAEWLSAQPDWELVTAPQLSVVCCRYAPPDLALAQVDALNQRLVTEMLEDGFAFLSTTRLRERPVLRLCFVNPRTTDDDVSQTLCRLDEHGRRLARQVKEERP